MKHLKTFESISKPYKIGDYAIVRILSRGILYEDILAELIEIDKSIIIKILNRLDIFDYKINRYLIEPNQMICWSEDRNQLEILIDSKKYNL
jgi:hypothetical protein